MADQALRTDKLSCRSCSAGCGMIVTLQGDQVLRAEGDRTHPVTGGYSCAKGRAIPERHHSTDRLDYPRVNGVQATWEHTLDDLGQRLNDIRAKYGAGSIGILGGTGGSIDTLGWGAMRRIAAALETPQFYTVGTVDTAPIYRAAQMVTGFHLLFPYWIPDFPKPSLAILIGLNPCVSHVYLGVDGSDPVRRLRRFRKRGGELWTIDPRRTKTASISDEHLAPRPGTDVFILAWLVREVLIDGYDADEVARYCKADDIAALKKAVEPFHLDLVARRSALAPEKLLALLAAIRKHRRLAILSGTGVAFTPTGLLADWLRWALLAITGSLDTADGMFFNATSLAKQELGTWSNPAPAEGATGPAPKSRPDLPSFYGEFPCAAMADEIESGNLRALIVFGSNPIAAFPEPQRVEQAMRKLDVLAVVDPFENDLTKLATHALPSTWQLERSDVRQRPAHIQYSPALLPAVADRKPGWWILGAIAQQMQIDLFGDGIPFATRTEADGYRHMMSHARITFDELQAGGVDGLPTPRLDGWVRDRVLQGRGWRIAPAPLIQQLANLEHGDDDGIVLVAGRVGYATNSMVFPTAVRKEGTPPPIHVSRHIAATHTLSEGQVVRIRTRAGALTGAVTIDDTLSANSVWMNHGWSARNVNDLFDSTGIDPLTVQPHFSAIPIKIEVVSPADG